MDACCTPLQAPIKAVEGAHRGSFKAQLLLQTEGSPGARWSKAREGIARVEGVKAVSEPDKVGFFKVALDTSKTTLLIDLVKAAKEAGVVVRDPKRAAR
ncbi:MAG: hypothetical protein IT207_05980 [Fimbriimonadaceae bacterium]|nr:hypothetical protein [Fimbriimonadaceae bacterium]